MIEIKEVGPPAIEKMFGRPLKEPSCYLAGPMTSVPDRGKSVFEHYAQKLRGEGWEVTSPYEINLFHLNIGQVLLADLQIIMAVDKVFLLPHYEQYPSNGTAVELAFCKAIGKQVVKL